MTGTIGGYTLEGEIGRGGMGTVYRARHTRLGTAVAIKILRPDLSQRTGAVERFFNEARAAASIEDPGIVQVLHAGRGELGAFVVMELLAGETLRARLERDGALDLALAMRVAGRLARSLAAAHAKRIVHRDLKPANVFLDGDRTKILDFGIAKLGGDHPHRIETTTGVIVGTPAYMSPEQCRGSGRVDHRADIYALGCVVYRMITGRLPFRADSVGDMIAAHLREPPPSPSRFVDGLPPEVDALVLRCLAKSPAQRFASMEAVAAALAAVPAARVTVRTITTVPPAPPPAELGGATLTAANEHVAPPARPRRRAVTWVTVSLAVTIVTLGIAGVGLRARDDAASAAPAPLRAMVDARPPDAAIPSSAPDDARAIDAAPPPVDAAPARPRARPARRLHSAPSPVDRDPLDHDGDDLPDERR